MKSESVLTMSKNIILTNMEMAEPTMTVFFDLKNYYILE
jgi:hypothetical protein